METKTLQKLCHERAANWWVDLETGEDVRLWPDKFFQLWVGSKLMLMVTELAEAMEGLRKGIPDDKLPHRSMLEVELADCVIRVFDLAGGLGLDIEAAMLEKLEFNRTRADHSLAHRKAAGGKSV